MANVVNAQSGTTETGGWGNALGLLGTLATPFIGPLGGLFSVAGNALNGNWGGALQSGLGTATGVIKNNTVNNDWNNLGQKLTNTAQQTQTQPNKYDSLLAMYGLNKGGNGTFDYNAAQDYYKNFGGGDGIFAALRRSYNDWM